MKKLKILLVSLAAFISGGRLHAQDPSFSQFFSSPLNVNPALTADINGKWRIISNYRSQWIGPGNPYRTGTISFDTKINSNSADNYIDENARLGVGGMMMYDQAMGGAFKSNYASFNVSGNIRLKSGGGYEINGNRVRHISKIKMDEGTGEQRLGIGLGIIYGHKRLDYTKLTFGEQWTGNGFDANLPSGEAGMSTMKPYMSTSAGIIYSFVGVNTNFDIGAAVFHLNKPRQSLLDDDNQFLPKRWVAHTNVESYLGERMVLDANAVYQKQAGASYFSVGGALGYFIPNDEKMMLVNAGLWYWSKSAIIPYVGFAFGNLQVGVTYDITISDLKNSPKRAQTFELCLILRGDGGRGNGVIPAPWK
ncbi:MAG TPA: PorP/SprF family type IX secretion system membrane protein [Chitinophagaceae bacterium]|nr:PorP/SprF family type IX secretion system membrane protein [Chitinophagaceae bacterium]